MLKGRARIKGPRLAGRMTSRSFMKFSKGKCQVLRLKINRALEQHRLENISAEKNLVVLVDNKLKESAVCPGSRGAQQHHGLC